MKSGQSEELEQVEYQVGKPGYQNVETYDAVRYSGPANEYKQTVMANAYKKLIGSLQGKSVLDVGCGTGRGVVEFAQTATLAVGADASRGMLAVAASKTSSGPHPALVGAQAQHLPFPDASFDVVITLNFLHLFRIELQRQMVAEMKRVLRPGGTLLLEFDNALHGLCVGMYKRWFGNERGSLPGEIRQVIGGGCRVVSVYGAVFPVVWRILHHFPRISVPVEKIAYVAPFNRLSHRIYYKALKEG